MFQNGISKEARKWLIWFFLKLNLAILAIFFIIEGILGRNSFLLLFGFVILPIGAILVIKDVQNDPYYLLRFLRIQFLLWSRLRGPFIARHPYNYYYPEGQLLQQYDVTKSLRINDQKLKQGGEKLVQIKIPNICSECGGKRNQPMTVQIECNKCVQGRQLHSINTINFPLPCNRCLGIGWIPVHPCKTCNGKGSLWKNKRIRVHIPPLSSPGTKLRIPTLGRVNPKTLQQGDLYIKLKKKIFNLL